MRLVNLMRFELLPGHRFDTVGVEPLLDGIEFGGLIADQESPFHTDTKCRHHLAQNSLQHIEI